MQCNDTISPLTAPRNLYKQSIVQQDRRGEDGPESMQPGLHMLLLCSIAPSSLDHYTRTTWQDTAQHSSRIACQDAATRREKGSRPSIRRAVFHVGARAVRVPRPWSACFNIGWEHDTRCFAAIVTHIGGLSRLCPSAAGLADGPRTWLNQSPFLSFQNATGFQAHIPMRALEIRGVTLSLNLITLAGHEREER